MWNPEKELKAIIVMNVNGKLYLVESGEGIERLKMGVFRGQRRIKSGIRRRN